MAPTLLPHSPLTTRLSGSAQETENRIRSIFQWQKKRPPLPVLAVSAVLILLCGSLVSCQQGTTFVSNVASGQVDQAALQEGLTQAVRPLLADPNQSVSANLLSLTPSDDGNYALGAVCVQTDTSEYLFALGVQDQRTSQLTAPVFSTLGTSGQPHVTTFHKDGENYLLYVANSLDQELTHGEAGLIRYDGTDFTWVWPVEGDVRQEGSQARKDYDTYWQQKKALMAPGGVDIFSATGYTVTNGDGPQWKTDHNEIFYPAPENMLSIPVPWQVRNWLEEFTRWQSNPLGAGNTSALWSIQSLAQTELTTVDLTDTQTAYILLAQADTDNTLCFAAHLIYDQEANTIEVYDYAMGSLDEVSQQMEDLITLSPGTDSQEFYTLAHQYYSQKYQGQTYYFGADQPDVPQENDVRLGPVSYAGSCRLSQGFGSAYVVETYLYHAGAWAKSDTQYLILLRDANGAFLSVLGEFSGDTGGMPVRDIILNAAGQAGGAVPD